MILIYDYDISQFYAHTPFSHQLFLCQSHNVTFLPLVSHFCPFMSHFCPSITFTPHYGHQSPLSFALFTVHISHMSTQFIIIPPSVMAISHPFHLSLPGLFVCFHQVRDSNPLKLSSWILLSRATIPIRPWIQEVKYLSGHTACEQCPQL